MEFISRYKPQDAIFGIANVEFQGCDLTIGYYLGEDSLMLILPETCHSCRKAFACTRKFGEQIINKYNQKHQGQETFFSL